MDDNAPSNPGPDDAREPATAATDTRPADPHEDRGPQVAAELTRVLAAFGAASVIGGGVLAVVSEDPTRRAFGQQTAMWGAINLAIAGVGAWRGQSHPAQGSRLRRTLLINAGLDVGYLATGAHMAHHRSTFRGRVSPEAARGHGLAVVIQAAGLMKLDLFYAWRLRD